MELLLNLGVEIDTGKVLQLFRVFALPLEGVFFVCVFVLISIDKVDVKETQRVQIMLDAVADEDRFATDLLEVLSDLS